MDLPSYPIVVSEDGMQFEFISIGKKGSISKMVVFSTLGFDTEHGLRTRHNDVTLVVLFFCEAITKQQHMMCWF